MLNLTGFPLPLFISRIWQKLSKFIPFGFFPFGPNRNCCRQFCRPLPRANSAVHYADRNSAFFRDFGIALSRWSNANNRSVSGLLFLIRPCAVIRGIAKRVVDSLNRQVIAIPGFLGPLLERKKLSPFFTDGNTTASVVFPPNVFLICAARLHVLPAHIKTCLFYWSWLASRNTRLTAAARGTFPASEVASANFALLPANTSAKPKRHSAMGIPGLMQNGPAAKNRSCHINQCRIFCHA